MNVPSDLDDLLRQTEAVRQLARRLVLDDDQTDDVLQEARLAAMKSPPPAGVPLRAWLSGIVKHLAARRRREDARRASRESARIPRPIAPQPHEILARAETHRALVKAVLSLKEPYRTTILLRFFDGLPPREIALQTGIPAATVSTHIHRGLARLRETLDAAHDGRRAPWCLALLPVATRGGSQALTSGTQTLAAGATLMTHKTLLVGALVLLLGIFFAARLLWYDDDGEPPEGPARLTASGSAEAPALAGQERPSGSGSDMVVNLPAPVDLARVDRERDLHGIVLDAKDGTPVAGAHLQAVFYPWQQSGFVTRKSNDEERLGAETRSAEDGTFRLRLRRGESVALRVDARGYAQTELRRLQAGERVEVALTRGLSLRVQVADESGAPIPDAHVRLRGHRQIQQAQATDEDGTAGFERLIRAEEVTLHAKHPAYGGSAWTRYQLPSAASAQKTLILPKGRVLTGRITCAQTGEPIAGARIGMGWTSAYEVRSAADGRYRLPGWSDGGRSSLTARAEGHGVMNTRVDELEVIDFALPKGASVHGRVVDASGAPVVGAYVGAFSVQNVKTGYATSKRVGRSDAEGRFELDSIRADLDLHVVAFAVGRGRYAERIASTRLADLALDLGEVPLSGARRVSGVVVDSDGEPVARLRLWLGLLPAGSRGQGSRPRLVFGRVAGINSDDLGRFHFRDLLPGRYQLSMRPEGQAAIRQILTLPETRDLTSVRVVIPATRTLRIGLHTPDGRPIPDIGIDVRGGDGSAVSGTPGEDGFLELQVGSDAEAVFLLFPGDTSSRYLGDGWRRLTSNLTEVRFVLQEALPTKGTLIGPDKRPVPGLQVAVEVAGKRLTTREADEQGHFDVPIPAGSRANLILTGVVARWRSGVKTLRQGSYRGRLDGVEAGQEGLVLRARKPASDQTLRVLVLLPSGDPAVGAQIRVMPAPVSGYATVRTDAQGRAELSDLYAEPLQVVAAYFGGDLPDNLGAVAQEGVVPAGQEITLRIRAGIPLKGVVVDAAGEPLAGVEVRVEGTHAWRRIVGHSDADGLWQVRIAPDDGERVAIGASFTLPDGKQVAGSLENVRVDTALVRLVLRPTAK